MTIARKAINQVMADRQHFKDNRALIFGRSESLEQLCLDVRTEGLTAVVGRPMSGKTWLLQELGRRLEEADAKSVALVGYYESDGAASDILLRCISNLYTHWLQQASLKNELDTLLARHKGQWRSLVGGVVSDFANAVSDFKVPVLSEVSDLVSQGIKKYLALSADHASGGLSLDDLTYDQARDLVSTLVKVSDRRVILIMDSWEKAPNLEMQKDILDKYLHHPEEWPRTHIALGIRREREDDLALQAIDALAHHANIQVRTLSSLAFDSDERDRLLAYLHQNVPAAAQVEDDDELLELIGGYAGVLDRWRKRKPADIGALKQVARDAQAARYPELKDALRRLPTEKGRVVARISLLPEITTQEAWEDVRDLVLVEEPETIVDDLQIEGIFETPPVEFPSFGHSTRRDAAYEWYTSDTQGRRYGQQEIERLLRAIHKRVNIDGKKRKDYLGILAKGYENAKKLHISDDLSYVGRAAQSYVAKPKGFWADILGDLGIYLILALTKAPSLFIADKIVDKTKGSEPSIERSGNLLQLRHEGIVAFLAALAQIDTDVALELGMNDSDIEREIEKTLTKIDDFSTDAVGDQEVRKVVLKDPENRLEAARNLDVIGWVVRRLDQIRDLAAKLEDQDLSDFTLFLSLLDAPRHADNVKRDQLLDQIQELAPEMLGPAIAWCLENLGAHAESERQRSNGNQLAAAEELLRRYLSSGDATLAGAIHLLIEWSASKPQYAAWQRSLLNKLREIVDNHPENGSVEVLWREAELFYSIPPVA